MPALRHTSPTAVPSSPCRRMKAICASENFDLFMVLPRPTARITHAAKLEFSSKDRARKRGAGHDDQPCALQVRQTCRMLVVLRGGELFESDRCHRVLEGA